VPICLVWLSGVLINLFIPLDMIRSNSKLKKIISKNMKKRRAELNMTQEDLAEKTKLSRVYIGYVEQGRNTPTLEILERIANALKIKTKDLLE